MVFQDRWLSASVHDAHSSGDWSPVAHEFKTQFFSGPLFPTLAFFFFVLPMFAFYLAYIKITYTYGGVVATLAAIEDTQAAAMVIPGEEDITLPPYTDEPKTPVDPLSKSAVNSTPAQVEFFFPTETLTSSFPRTLAHLQSRGGKYARYRGFALAAIISASTMAMSNFLSHFALPSAMVMLVIHMLVQLGVARLKLTWTHIVISEPSSKYWWQRLASRRATRKILLPTMAWAIVQTVVSVVPFLMFSYLVAPSLRSLNNPDGRTANIVTLVATVTVTLTVSFMLLVGLWFPMQVAFTRTQAALLSPDETPIVPFDRSFGGRVQPEAEGRASRLRLRDAWKSLDKASRRRVARVYLKTFGYQAMLFVTACVTMLILSISFGLLAASLRSQKEAHETLQGF